MPEQRVLLFLKWPAPGRVKTRLAATLGAQAAADLYRAFVADELHALAQAGIPVTICHDPDGATEADYRDWIAQSPLTPAAFLPQHGNDIGQRMAAAFADTFQQNIDQAALVGSDVPLLSPSDVTATFHALTHHGAALAPSSDDGYTIIAFTRAAFTPDVFHHIPWSTPDVLPTTIGRFRDLGYPLALLPDLTDVDDEQALAEMAKETTLPKWTAEVWRRITEETGGAGGTGGRR